ncbi:DUF1684 domain-containing protein [Demequina sp.]|uniref:DUF1684 domain-containing protein n=1 Tax=Demequina sp. TaxID=2050685 RepID=UPI003A8A5503
MDTWDVRDWRLRVAELYREVRALSAPEQAHRRWIAGRDALLAGHAASPVPLGQRDGFRARVATYDPAYRFVVEVQPAPVHRREVPTPTDGLVPFERIGKVELPGLGTLDVWWLDSYGGGIFLPLRDGGAGAVTYGGGRYVLDTVKGADLGGTGRELVVDLNFSYQPSCAYSSEWVCPLPGSGNRLDAEVAVGELMPS